MKTMKNSVFIIAFSFLVTACGSDQPASSVEQIQKQSTEKDIEKAKENKRKLIGRDREDTEK